ncbi:MAG: sodium:calcium antiporter [Puniceicoccales bacterium]|jgi:cation:H+ antiporter|nr:sodium:calcium antiporter [Puniceicoccales bacterium]
MDLSQWLIIKNLNTIILMVWQRKYDIFILENLENFMSMPAMALLHVVFFLVIGFMLLIYGAKFFCDSTLHILRKFNINSAMVEIFLISIGTAAPDLVATITAVLEDHPNIAMGNIVGSNFSNLTLGFGIASLISPFKCDRRVALVEFPLLLALTIFFTSCCLRGQITRCASAVFLTTFVVYLLFPFLRKKSKNVSDKTCLNVENFNLWSTKKSGTVFISSIVLLTLGAHLVVTSCYHISNFFKISETFIGFSLLALGTSAPEIFVVTTAAKQRHYTICSGNIIGSNLLNLMLITGVCTLIHPLYFAKGSLLMETCALILITMITWYIFAVKKVFSRKYGLMCVATYFLVVFFLHKSI